MRQFLKSGSVRGVRSNPHPYRDRQELPGRCEIEARKSRQGRLRHDDALRPKNAGTSLLVHCLLSPKIDCFRLRLLSEGLTLFSRPWRDSLS